MQQRSFVDDPQRPSEVRQVIGSFAPLNSPDVADGLDVDVDVEEFSNDPRSGVHGKGKWKRTVLQEIEIQLLNTVLYLSISIALLTA